MNDFLMLPKFCLPITFLLLFFLAPPLWAQQVEVEKVSFEITDLRRVPEGDRKPGYLALVYQLTNHDDKKKLSLEGDLTFRVVDEFGNEYRQLPHIPDGEPQDKKVLPSGFPSIYPGETYGETLFFEKPVAKANNLVFFINAEALGIASVVRIPLDLNPGMDREIEIVNPLEGAVLEQGQVARLNVRITGGIAPKRIIVLGFQQTYADENPALENVYDINIPTDYPVGPEIINIIAQWRPEHDSLMRSSYVNVTVKDALPLDVL